MNGREATAELTHFLYPGMVYADGKPTAVTTILGSCVSICLWDPVLRIGGMNHYLLPYWNGDGLKTPKYGNIAIPLLVEKLLALGSKKQHLVAKVFGGASVLESSSAFINIGERNVMLAEETVAEEGLKVAGRDTGGDLGRKVMFLTESGEVYVKKVKKSERG